MKKLILLVMAAISASSLFAQSEADFEVVEKIKTEATEQSQIMDLLSWVTDVYGPRLTNSSQMDRAADFAVEKLNEWGLDKVEKHQWGPFGKSWELRRFALHASSDNVYFPVLAYPKAWSPGYKRAVKGDVVILKVDSTTSLESYKGKLKGKFVLIEDPIESEPNWDGLAERRDAENLLNLANAGPTPPRSRNSNPRALARAQAAYQKALFLQDEQPLAILDMSYRGWNGQVAVSQATLPSDPSKPWYERPRAWDVEAPEPVPQLSLAREHYGRMYRMVEKGIKVELEMELKVNMNKKDLYDFNIIGEIEGSDPELRDEIVMLGAHFDSWHTGTGTTDNAAGSVVMMEAVRILKSLGLRPKRTVRIALWTGEEQGLFGSINYVQDTFAEKTGNFWTSDSILIKSDEYDRFSAYYNLDNGVGQIRGVYLQQNEQVRPIFRRWLRPFSEWDSKTLSYNNTGGTDHLAFDYVGLPGFQFIQDPIEYGTLTHHSNMDVYERAIEQDLQRNAAILASFVYLTAQMEEKLPRKEGSLVIVR